MSEPETWAGDIIERHRMYGWSEPGGEVGAVYDDYRTVFRSALGSGDGVFVEAVLANMMRLPLSTSLTSEPRSAPGRSDWEVQLERRGLLAGHLALWVMVSDDADVERLRCGNAGNPMLMAIERRSGERVPVAVDSFRFDSYAQRIARVIPSFGTVLEIGPGYGGLAIQLLRILPSARIVLCDLPETLYLAGYILDHEPSIDVAWWDEGNPSANVILLPEKDLEAWTEPIDLVFSAHSLSNMGRVNTARYMDWLERSGPRYFYHDDATKVIGGAWMTDTYPELLASEMGVPSCYVEQWCERIPWTGLDDRFCEFFYERASG